jgi:hypothetical protein
MDIYAHIYDASSINLKNWKLTLDTTTNPYVKFLDLSNNIKISVPTNVINCNIVSTSYNNIFSYRDKDAIINYENMYFLYQNELHQIKSSDISNNHITLFLKDIFNYDISHYNSDDFIIIKNINSLYDTSGTTGTTYIELIDISGTNMTNKILYYNNSIANILAINGNTITIEPTLNNMPKYKDTCYIIDASSVIYKTNIPDINISRTSNIILDIDASIYDYKYFVTNHKIYDILNIDISNITIDSSVNINVSNNVVNYLITDLEVSSNIIDIYGNKSLNTNYEGTGTLVYINNDINHNFSWSLIFNNQNYSLTTPIGTNLTTQIIYLDTPLINMPKENNLYTLTLTIPISVSDIIKLPKNNHIICINDITDVDYTNYNITVNNQVVQIKYYYSTYKLCVLDRQLIFLNNELINANCILFNNEIISFNSTLRNNSIIVKNNTNFDYIVYLNILSSSEINYYNNI